MYAGVIYFSLYKYKLVRGVSDESKYSKTTNLYN